MKESSERRNNDRCWSLKGKISEDERRVRGWRLKLKWLHGWWIETEWNNWIWLNRWCGTDLRKDLKWLVKRNESNDPVIRNDSEWDEKIETDEEHEMWLLGWLLIVRKESLNVRKDPLLSDLRTEWLVGGSKWMWQDERSFVSFDLEIEFLFSLFLVLTWVELILECLRRSWLNWDRSCCIICRTQSIGDYWSDWLLWFWFGIEISLKQDNLAWLFLQCTCNRLDCCLF